jgi:Mn2+/Fe2+ NRAMP family transporter
MTAAQAPPGPTGTTPVAVRRRRPRVLVLLSGIGPGLIAANAGNDAGGVLTYASAGAQFAYRTLFVMVLVTVGLVVVQEMSARLGAYTGEGLVSLIREHFPLRLAAFAVACLVVANVGLVVSEFAGIGAAFELFGVSRYVSVPLAAIGLWAAVAFGSYRYAERVFLVLSFVFVVYPIAAVLGHPHWATVTRQTLWPHFAADHDFVLLIVALIGTTITPYMQLYQAAAVADKGVDPDDYPTVRADAVAGAIFADVVSMFIIIATAAAIGGHGPLASARDAARALQPAAGPAAEHLFAVGLLGASALAAAVVPLSTAYAIAEALGWRSGLDEKPRRAKLFYATIAGSALVGMLVNFVGINPIRALVWTSVLNGVLAPPILVVIMRLANDRRVLGDRVNGLMTNVAGWLTTAAMFAAAIALLWTWRGA